MPKRRVKVKVTIKKKPKTPVESSYVISKYYGFDDLDLPSVTKQDKEIGTKIRKDMQYEDKNMNPLEEEISLIKNSREEHDAKPGSPLMIYREGFLKGTHKKPTLKQGEKVVNLHIIGTPKSIAEAILIKTSLSILEEEGYKDLSIEINNVGGKEALANFTKEVTAYYRKNLNNMNSKCRQLFKDGPHALIACSQEIDKELRDSAPSPLNFLTEANRNHFKEVVEYLESQDIPYEINKDILGDPNYSSHTVFSIIDNKTGKIMATGSRCNQLCKKIGYKKEIPAVTARIKLNKTKKVPAIRIPDHKKTKFFFIQIGFNAKLKSLQVIEMLRKAKIPVAQTLSKDRLSTQLEAAKRLRAPYILLMGQQEAKENTVVVRDAATHSQEAVPFKDLVDYLKKLK